MLRWKLTLSANICMRNIFLLFVFVPFVIFFLFFCFVLFFGTFRGIFSRQCLGVLPSVLTVYSVCHFVSPGRPSFGFIFPNSCSHFEVLGVLMLFVLFSRCRHFVPTWLTLDPHPTPETLNCSITSVEHSFGKTVSTCSVELGPGASPLCACSPLPSSFCPPCRRLLVSSWRRHLALNSLSSDIMTSSKKLARRSLLQGRWRRSLQQFDYDKLPGKNETKKRKPKALLLILLPFFFCVWCVLLWAGISRQLSKRFP